MGLTRFESPWWETWSLKLPHFWEQLIAWCCLRLQLMNGFLTFWQFWRRVTSVGTGSGISKKAQRCPGQMAPSGTWSATSSSKMLRNLSKIGTTQTLLGNMSNIDICWKPGLAAKNTYQRTWQIHWEMFQNRKTSLYFSYQSLHWLIDWVMKVLYKGAIVWCIENETTELHFCLWQGWIRWTYTLKFHTRVWYRPRVHHQYNNEPVWYQPGVDQFLPAAWVELLALAHQNNHGAPPTSSQADTPGSQWKQVIC